ncbi:MAG: hypothetical protein JXA67_06655 [Micromonosporaceae bacterium]|nr:hypothetical protein [Micromonosporaceae bacterium]
MHRTGGQGVIADNAVSAAGQVAIPSKDLPPHHRNPFDRMLVAPAVVEGLTLASRDASIAFYDVNVLKI